MPANVTAALAAALAISLGASAAAWADGPCPSLSPDRGPLGFRRRLGGDRCEGFFKSNVAGEALSVAFLMAGRFPASAEVVEVSGAAPGREINVRAVALPLGTYYRMDATVGPNRPLRWPLAEVVQASRSLKSTDLGLYGWIGDAARPTYVPVRAALPGAAPAADEPLRLGVRANVPLALLVYNVADDESCHFGKRPWTEIGANVRPGAILTVAGGAVAGGRAAICVGFRAKLADSDQSEPMTVRIHLR
jgi:hypothetical protein